jgi:hypothetical protein
MNSYSDGFANAIYSYNKFDTPITINGKLENDTLALIEKTKKGDVSAILQFFKPDFTQNELNGFWINQTNKSKLKIRLTKSLEFNSYDKSTFDKTELMQACSTEDNYFRLLLSKEPEEMAEIVGVRVYQKKTDKLIQEIQLSGRLNGLNTVLINDFNFDGLPDFSVLSEHFSGANTASTYLLRNSKSQKYFISKIQGISLEFDADKKLVHEHSQCCAGSQEDITTYKIVNNEMVLVGRKCFKYSEKTESLVEVECE